MDEKIPVLAIMLGDHAGSSPEMAAKVLLEKHDRFVPVVVGNKARFNISRSVVTGGEQLHLIDWDGKTRPAFRDDPMDVYFYDVPAGPDIRFSHITYDSGKLQYDTIFAGVQLNRIGMVDGLLMAPITKAAFHTAGYHYSTEFDLFADLYEVPEVTSVVAAETYFRATVVGHCAFKDIYSRITTEKVENTIRRLIENMEYFMDAGDCHVAVAALNPHAGENGLFGDEESTVLQPAIDHVRADGYDVFGPWPCDTAINRVKSGAANGIVFMYHDQGNIAQKAAEFGGLRLIYVGYPSTILSVGHGPAYGKAGKGTADPSNLIASMKTLYQIVLAKMEQ